MGLVPGVTDGFEAGIMKTTVEAMHARKHDRTRGEPWTLRPGRSLYEVDCVLTTRIG
jgi:hypothetical protein